MGNNKYSPPSYEGNGSKGGHNGPPTIPRPSEPPKGQGAKQQSKPKK